MTSVYKITDTIGCLMLGLLRKNILKTFTEHSSVFNMHIIYNLPNVCRYLFIQQKVITYHFLIFNTQLILGLRLRELDSKQMNSSTITVRTFLCLKSSFTFSVCYYKFSHIHMYGKTTKFSLNCVKIFINILY